MAKTGVFDTTPLPDRDVFKPRGIRGRACFLTLPYAVSQRLHTYFPSITPSIKTRWLTSTITPASTLSPPLVKSPTRSNSWTRRLPLKMSTANHTTTLLISGTCLSSRHPWSANRQVSWMRPLTVSIVVTPPADRHLTLESPGSLAAPPASSTNQTYGYGQPSHSGHYWPEAGQQTQFYHPGFFNQDYSSDSPVAPEPSVVIPTPSSGKSLVSLGSRVLEYSTITTVPFNYWEEIQSGPSTSKFYMVSARARLSSCNPVDAFPQENVNTYHQPSTGPIRTELMSVGGYRPYERSRTQRNEHRNAEAGPSTLAPSPIPYVGLSTLQPSGGVTSESTADAEQVQTIKEEDKVPVSNFYCSLIPHVIEWLFGVRRSPSGPSALVAKDLFAPTACGRRGTL